MKKFWKQNKITILIMIGLIVIISLIYFFYEPAQEFFNAISIILAMPSFLISFVVLKVLNVTPRELDRYYRTRKIKDTKIEINRSEFKIYLEEKLATTDNSLRKFEEYLKHKSSNDPINKQLINHCKKSYEDLSNFYFKTKDCVQTETLNFTTIEDSLSPLDPTDYSDVNMSEEDLSELGTLLKSLSNDYFKEEALNTDKIKELTKIFDIEDGLFKKYFSICKVTFKSLGGEINE